MADVPAIKPKEVLFYDLVTEEPFGFTDEFFIEMLSGKIRVLDTSREEVSPKRFIKLCTGNRDFNLINQVQTVVYDLISPELVRSAYCFEPDHSFSAEEALRLKNVLSLAQTSLIQNSPMGNAVADMAERVLSSPKTEMHKELRAEAFLASNVLDNVPRTYIEYMDKARGIEDKVTGTLLNKMMQNGAGDFSRLVFNVVHPDNKDRFPEDTRGNLFKCLRMLSSQIPAKVGQVAFQTLRENIEPFCTGAEREVLNLVSGQCNKAPPFDFKID